MKNSLNDLNNFLFSQLERLNDDNLEGEGLSNEIERTKAVTLVSNQIIQNAKLVLEAKTLLYDRTEDDFELPTMIEG